MTKIYLRRGPRILLFPVTPPEITVQEDQKVTVYDTAAGGEILHIGRPALREVSFSSIFPGVYVSWAHGHDLTPADYIQLIGQLRADRQPVRLTVTGLGLSMDAAISAFQWSQKKGMHIYYSITLKEWRGEADA